MKEEKQIIGEISVEVKAGLYVDEKTFRTCMDLASIHARDKGLKGMVIFFDDENPGMNSIIPLETEKTCSRVWDAAYNRKEEQPL